MIPAHLHVSEDALRSFCRKWRVVEIDLFGSALGPNFGPDSDVDLLVEYSEDAHPTLIDEAHMLDELEALFGRPVHFMTKRAVQNSSNPIRRNAILESATPLHVESS